jgi:hypothetical protein
LKSNTSKTQRNGTRFRDISVDKVIKDRNIITLKETRKPRAAFDREKITINPCFNFRTCLMELAIRREEMLSCDEEICYLKNYRALILAIDESSRNASSRLHGKVLDHFAICVPDNGTVKHSMCRFVPTIYLGTVLQ